MIHLVGDAYNHRRTFQDTNLGIAERGMDHWDNDINIIPAKLFSACAPRCCHRTLKASPEIRA